MPWSTSSTSDPGSRPRTRTLHVRSEVRIGRPEIDSPVGLITARRVYLQLEQDGYEIRPGNRLGEPVKTGYVEDTKLVTETNRSKTRP